MEYTQWVVETDLAVITLCLNPCCNGIYSMRDIESWWWKIYTVLILVVMEYTQWDPVVHSDELNYNVLILVVMEYTQWGFQ